MSRVIVARRVAAALLLASFSLGGCTRWVVQDAPVSDVLAEPREDMIRVTMKDGTHVTLWQSRFTGDAVNGLRKVSEPVEGAVLHQRQRRTRYDDVTIPLSDISAIALSKRSPLRTALFVSGTLAALAAFGIATSDLPSNTGPQ